MQRTFKKRKVFQKMENYNFSATSQLLTDKFWQVFTLIPFPEFDGLLFAGW